MSTGKEEKMWDEIRFREIKEARLAGEEAVRCLRLAKEKLSSAGNWGIVDMLGGGAVSTFAKHSKMNAAEEFMEDAREKMKLFEKELEKMHLSAEIHLEVGDFLKFADYFFDNVVADWMVQTKISDAKDQVEDAIAKTEVILHRFDEMERNMVEVHRQV